MKHMMQSPAGTTSLCETCRRVNNVTLSRSHQTHKHDSIRLLDLQNDEIDPGLTVGEIQSNATTCLLCSMIMHLMQKSKVEGIENTRRTTLRFISQYGAVWDGKSSWPPGDGWARSSIRHGGIAAIGLFIEDFAGTGRYKRMEFGLPVSAQEHTADLIKRLCVRRVMDNQVESSLDKAKAWISTCEETHWRCCWTLSGTMPESKAGQVNFPTRLIFLPSCGTVKIQHTRGKKGRFAALSYRWGPAPHVKLQKARLKEWSTNLPEEKLSLTIQDAIRATRVLGFEYLWVDALCIVQDDDETWTSEAAEMPQIFQHANVVLTALTSSSSADVPLFRRDDVEHRSFELPWYGKEPQPVGTFVVSDKQYFKAYDIDDQASSQRRQDMEASSWFTRGWTLQEWILSRRIVYFGQHQLYWECQTQVCSEDGYDEHLRGLHAKRSYIAAASLSQSLAQTWLNGVGGKLLHQSGSGRHVAQHILTQCFTAIGTVFPTQSLLNTLTALQHAYTGLGAHDPTTGFLLDSLVKDYSARHLTEPADKLVAFEGVAKAFAERTNQEYHSGLWTHCLAQGLFWSFVDSQAVKHQGSRAPSWSWAAWDARTENYASMYGYKVPGPTLTAYHPRGRSSHTGDLRSVTFINENPIMDHTMRSSNPKSLKTEAICNPAFRSIVDCTSYHLTVEQMLRSLQMLGHHPFTWERQRCYLLFTVDSSVKPHATVRHSQRGDKDLGSNTRSCICEMCGADIINAGEAVMLTHAESCSGPGSAGLTEQPQLGAKLIGIGLFDDPASAPKTFEMLTLWHDPYQTAMRKPPQVLSRLEEQLQPKTSHLSIARVWSNRNLARRAFKKSYSTLLVEKVPNTDGYRRIGIGFCFWYPLVSSYGGVDLAQESMRKVVTLF